MASARDIFDSLRIISSAIPFYQEYIADQKIGQALNQFSEITRQLDLIMGALVEELGILDRDSIMSLLQELSASMLAKDYIYVCDMLVQLLLPQMNAAMAYMYENYSRDALGILPECELLDEKNTRTYSIEYNNCGEATLVRRGSEKLYYHSNICARLGGYRFAKTYVDSETDEYIVLGIGLGYDVSELVGLALGAKVTVYEPDAFVYQLYQTYGIKSDAEVILDTDYSRLTRRLMNCSQNVKFVISRPCLTGIDDEKIRKSFEDFFWVQNSVNDQRMAMEWNFRNNMKLACEDVWDIKNELAGKQVIFVAGGPSLDNDMEVLKKYYKRIPIICAGTVYKKLVKAGIVPDYTIIIDVKKNMVKQVVTDATGCKLIALSSANHEAVKAFAGQVYIAFQNGFNQAVKLAQQRNVELFETGGSVSCFAIDMLIRFGCRKVICLGLDLAYTYGMGHASDTQFAGKKRGSRTCRSVEGGSVETAPNFEIYRKWIEGRIKSERQIEFINTAKGAYIEGMKHIAFENMEVTYGE